LRIVGKRLSQKKAKKGFNSQILKISHFVIVISQPWALSAGMHSKGGYAKGMEKMKT
jgi:hypothetical protein